MKGVLFFEHLTASDVKTIVLTRDISVTGNYFAAAYKVEFGEKSTLLPNRCGNDQNLAG